MRRKVEVKSDVLGMRGYRIQGIEKTVMANEEANDSSGRCQKKHYITLVQFSTFVLW